MGQFDSPIEGFLNQYKAEPRNIVVRSLLKSADGPFRSLLHYPARPL
jgi:hypothetical protein